MLGERAIDPRDIGADEPALAPQGAGLAAQGAALTPEVAVASEVLAPQTAEAAPGIPVRLPLPRAPPWT